MYTLIAQYPRQAVCRDRQYTGLLRWAAYVVALPVPVPPAAAPDEDWIKQRIVAGRVSINPLVYVEQTISGVASTPDVQTNIRQHLHAFNDEGVEAAMDAQVDGALAVVMPAFCRASVTEGEVQAWLNDNGFAPPAAV
jgi:hypothetical protein